jgi:phage terminase large subunit-like protein
VALAAECGVTLDPWQRYVLEVGLMEDDDGLFAAFVVVLLVARQNGKTAVIAALVLGFISLLEDELIIYSAHQFKTTKETFRLVNRMVQNGPLRSLWKKNRESGVETAIEFTSGARIIFVARSGSSGRGFTSGKVVLDEGFSLQQAMLGALLPTLSAMPNPQVWVASSAPMHDSDGLHNLRERALGDTPGRLALLEWSAEEGVTRDDRRAWAQANPALGYRITERFIEDELNSLSAREFERERLGIGDDPDGQGAFDAARWQTLIDGDSSVPRPLAFGFDVTPERDQAAIAVAGVRIDDARAHVEVVEHLPGNEWCLARLTELYKRWEAPVWIELSSPAAAFIEPLQARGVDVRTQARTGGAAPLFADAITNGTLRHLGQASLTSALLGARRKLIGDTWAWSRSSSTVDICPLVAGSLAHYGAMVEPAQVRVGMY